VSLDETVTVDGSQGEGGGQVVRTSLFLSVLAQKPLLMTRIRAGRSKPGLRPQHLAVVRLLSEMTGATTEGDRVGSTHLSFSPGRPRSGSYRYDVGTAGSLTLLLQALLPVALITPGRVRLGLVGGTDVPFSPTFDWFANVYAARIAPLADRFDVRLERRGFHPAGGGSVRVETEGAIQDPVDLDAVRRLVAERLGKARLVRGKVVEAQGTSVAHEELAHADVAARQRRAARAGFHAEGLPTPRVAQEYVDAASKGTSVCVWLVDERGNRWGGDALGRPGHRAEAVGAEAAAALIEDWRTGATVDRHLADHLAPWIGLAMGAVRVPVATPHLRTNVDVVRQFMGAASLTLEGDVLRGSG
jgi:RNA 3'-phosphate cyclase